jgi:dTDP-4-dehydrorhamnose reductase
MIVLLGATGYVGQAFALALQQTGIEFVGLSRRQSDYSDFKTLIGLLQRHRPQFLINAAGFTGTPNVDRCEIQRAETVTGNIVLPLTVSHACQSLGIPWGHVSSGCIYSGAYIRDANGQWEKAKDLSRREIRRVLDESPESVRGFYESDEPNFSFRQPPCSFYSGCKALAEENLAQDPSVYCWRLRVPFNEIDHPRNYLTKLQQYPKVYDNVNSLSHLNDFASACLELWQRGADFGTYNITNPGYISARQITEMIATKLPRKSFTFWANDAEFYHEGAVAPRSNCVLDTTKLANAGVRLRGVREAITDALDRWQSRGEA